MPTAANRYGIAALKLLRPLFEKAVTMKYLIAHPDKIDDFLDYFWVNAQRSMAHMKHAGHAPSPEQAKQIEAGFARVRNRYLEDFCKKCGTTRPMASWTKLNLADMAKHVDIGRTYMALCYIPTLQIHATMQGLMNWTREIADGRSRAIREGRRSSTGGLAERPSIFDGGRPSRRSRHRLDKARVDARVPRI